MTTAVSAKAIGETPPPGSARMAENRYGHFSADGREFCITDPRTPRPWVNIIANPRFGLAVSQTGSGFTWLDNSQLGTITRWEQDLVRDSSGKFVYARDADTGALWSLSPAPTWPKYDAYACRHGLGYTIFETSFAGVAAAWTLFAHARDPIELWRVELHNTTDRPRRIELCGFLEWCCGVQPSPRREFHKLFLETSFDADRRAVFARNHMWEVPNARFGHWNTDFPYTSAFACTEPLLAAEGSKDGFLGRYGNFNQPAALSSSVWKPRFGRFEDAIAALRMVVVIPPGERRTVGFAVAASANRRDVETLLEQNLHVDAMDAALGDAEDVWAKLLAAQRIETTDATVDHLINDWSRYQAIAGRLWGRCGYYQQSGAFGFRDQLQDSQVWLTIDPPRCRAQINLHAAHQFADGSVYHWWHPLSEQGHITRMTDDLLWLAFVTANYIKETGDFSVLDDKAPFLDEPAPQPIREHVRRAFARVFARSSQRGLPFIGAGDWNDGLSAVGLQEKGESFWLAHFLAGLLGEWAEVYRRTNDAARADEFTRRRAALIQAINTYGWDGKWYVRATLDDGGLLGSSSNRVGRIFLNAQTWAILNDIAPHDRAALCMDSVRKHLVSEVGALLLTPAFDKPVSEIGYITRYAAGLRENGGVYTHAATWAIAAFAKVGDAATVGKLLDAIDPAKRDPERYWAEPYVLPGNVDGPESPYFGRGGWTWYTGSAAWLHRVVTQWVFGVRPEWDGLVVQPCLPPSWNGASMTRPYRGCPYRFKFERQTALPAGALPEVVLNGERLAGNVIPPPAKTGAEYDVVVKCR